MMETPEQFGIKDSERARCEIWTLRYGIPPTDFLFQHRKAGGSSRTQVFLREKSSNRTERIGR